MCEGFQKSQKHIREDKQIYYVTEKYAILKTKPRANRKSTKYNQHPTRNNNSTYVQ